MACRFYYKGQLFESEAHLDNFILTHYGYQQQMGDLVFSLSDEQVAVRGKLGEIYNKYQEIRKKHREWLNAGNDRTFDELGEEVLNPDAIKPYLGVNSFLAKYTDDSGLRLFPEFLEKEYWDRRFQAWERGEFNDVEIEVFNLGRDPRTYPKIHKDDVDSATGKKMRDVYKDQITAKWKVQGYIGNTIHNILEICLGYNGYDATTKEPLTHLSKSDSELKQYILANIEDKNKKYVIDDVIDQTIAYARLLKAKLERDFDGPLMFYPEFGVTQLTSDPDNPVHLLGIIDLLVIDKHGVAHILDYKTSIHDYSLFSKPKRLAYQYQMATYQRMLEKYGINTTGGRLMVAPIKITGFIKNGDHDEDWTYTGMRSDSEYDILNPTMNNPRIWDTLDELLPAPVKVNPTLSNVMTDITDVMLAWFPQYEQDKAQTIDTVTEWLKRKKLLTKNSEGNFVYKTAGKKADIVSDSESDFVAKVLKYFEDLGPKRERNTLNIKQALKDTVVNGMNPTLYPAAYSSNIDATGSATWLTDSLAKYGDGNWEVVDAPDIELFGLIMLQTKDIAGVARQVDIIRVSSKILTSDYRGYKKGSAQLQERSLLTSAFVPDIVESSKSDSLVLPATQGNVELMETMLVLNQMANIDKFPIGSVTVVNPDMGNGMTASNEELLYNFNALSKYKAAPRNRFKEGSVKMASKFEILRQDFNHIMLTAKKNNFEKEYSGLRFMLSELDAIDAVADSDVPEKLKALSKLLDAIKREPAFNSRVMQVKLGNANLLNDYVRLHNDILIAMAQLKGIDFRQQLDDHDKWLQTVNVLTLGAEGTYLDNPGNQGSSTLNTIAKLVTEAYQNTRDDLLRERAEIFEKIEALKESKGYNALSATYKNLVDLYKNLWEFTPDGNDMLFKDPDSAEVYLTKAERDVLEMLLEKINKRRFPLATELELQHMRETGDVRYWRVPLARGGDDSMASTRGLLANLKSKLHYLMHPKEAIQAAREAAEGFFSASLKTSKHSGALLFQMLNMFNEGDDPQFRANYLQRRNNSFEVEQNMESLLYKFLFANSVERNMNGVFPMIRAAVTHLSLQGAMQNKNFDKDFEYASDYIRNKIMNQPIVPENLESLALTLSRGRNLVSTAILAMSPVQAIYQPLQGLWQDISLFIRKPDGKNSFTKDHLSKALKMAYGDLTEFSEKPTLCQLFNETYGLNDMDMNQYAERLSTSKRGIWNLHNLAFKFASRPDFYNRMTIWLSQMMGDGCLDAHKVEGNKLVYDWTLDKRFDAFAKDDKSDSRYNEQKALYYTMAQQFMAEHAKNPDGSDFIFDPHKKNPLPRAYTNKEAEGMKSLADDIYGYYSHEKKSLILATFIGSMWLQFKTYWSGKKNQYAQSGGVRLRGNWEQYSENIPKRNEAGEIEYDENGNMQFELNSDGTYKQRKYYYQTDAEGNILFGERPITEDDPEFDPAHAVPFMLWKGRWQEGIILTLSDVIRQSWNKKSFTYGLKAKWNDPDPMMRLVYQSNIKQAAYDVIALALIGGIIGGLLGAWLDDLKKAQRKKPTFGGALAVDTIALLLRAIRSSAMDLNAYDSVINPLVSWDPIMFSWGGSQIGNFWSAATGDSNFVNAAVKTNAATKSMQTTLKYILLPED